MNIVFDTEALLIYYLDEPGAHRVQELLEKTQKGESTAYLNIVKLADSATYSNGATQISRKKKRETLGPSVSK